MTPVHQDWTSTNGNQPNRNEISASLHQPRGCTTAPLWEVLLFPTDDDKIQFSNSYIKISQMK